LQVKCQMAFVFWNCKGSFQNWYIFFDDAHGTGCSGKRG
jgi:hypothetical protein